MDGTWLDKTVRQVMSRGPGLDSACRTPQRWPLWIDFCHAASDPCSHAATVRDRLVKGDFQVWGTGVGSGASLLNGMRRVAALALDPRARPDGTEEALLQAALTSMSLGVEANHEAATTGVPVGAGCSVELPVLLVSSAASVHPGTMADLRMWRIEGGSSADRTGLFVRAPQSFLYQLEVGSADEEEAFASALLRATRVLESLLGVDMVARGTRLVWDLVPRRVTMRSPMLTGPSAGASFALAGLHLLRDLLPASEDDLKHSLGSVHWPRAVVTARLSDDAGSLGKVGQLNAKLTAMEQNAAGITGVAVPRKLFVAQVQYDEIRADRKLSVVGADDVRTLARKLAWETRSYPDYVAELGLLGGGTAYATDDLMARPWLTQAVKKRVDGVAESGGIVILGAPMGCGKTAMAARWVLDVCTGVPGSLGLGAWAFARASAGAGTQPAHMSAQAATVMDQLYNCANERLGLGLADLDAAHDPGTVLADLLNACAHAARARQAPVVLLIDAVDEIRTDEGPQDIASLLPVHWPKGVVLLLTTRTPELEAFGLPVSSPMRRVLRCPIDAHMARADIRAYLQRRASGIEAELGRSVFDERFIDALCRATDGFFIVASGLLGRFRKGQSPEDRQAAIDELERWRRQPETIPQGPEAFFNAQLDRVIHRAVRHFADRRVKVDAARQAEDQLNKVDALRLVEGLLGMVSTSAVVLTATELMSHLAAMRRMCRAPGDAADAWRNLWGRPPAEGPAEVDIVDALQMVADLFTATAGEPSLNFQLTFSHGWLQQIAEARLAAATRQHLTVLWSSLCVDYGPEGALRFDRLAVDAVLDYVDRFGIRHLLQDYRYAEALRLCALVSAPDFERSPELERELPQLSESIAHALTAAMSKFETASRHDAGRWRQRLSDIRTSDLIGLLKRKRYQTSMYAGAIEALITFHEARWEDHRGELLHAFDIVVRHDFGQAYFSLWKRDTARRAAIHASLKERAIAWVAGDAKQRDVCAYEREVAGYALKYIWQAAALEGLDLFDPVLITTLAQSPSASDRMIANEILLQSAMANASRLRGFELPPRMQQPVWHYERADSCELRYLLALDKNALLDGADPDLRHCARRHADAATLAAALQDTDLVRGGGSELRDLLSPKGTQLLLSIKSGELAAALAPLREPLRQAGAERHVALQVLRVLLHQPLWVCIEAVTAALALLLTQAEGCEELVATLRLDPWWQVRYGAIDLAYNIGDRDDYQCFLDVLTALGRDDSPRVAGLSGDTFLGWVRESVDAGKLSDLHRPAIQDLVRHWVRQADDSWLLEYLYLLFRYLDEQQVAFDHLLPPAAEWSRFLRVDPPFYRSGHTDFLIDLEAFARAT